jgi:hypothetical protein
VTVQEIITASLNDLGVLEGGEQPTADDAAQGLSALNTLVDQWAAERLMLSKSQRTTRAITPGLADYTIGPSGLIVIARPVYLDALRISDSASTPAIEYQMRDSLTDEGWANVSIKSLTSPRPTEWYYNPTFPNGTLTLWPVPTSSTLTLVIYYPVAVTEFLLTDTISLPPGYRRMIQKVLAMELGPSYDKKIDAQVIQGAARAEQVVKRSNVRLRDMAVEPAALGRRHGSYNILIDR